MKNLKYLLLLMVAASLSFVSCTEKEGDDDDGGGDDIVKVDMLVTKSINKVDDSYSEYLYNADNTLKQITYKAADGTDLPYYEDYSYTNGKLTTFTYYNNSAPTVKITITYNGDLPSLAKYQADQGAGLADYYDLYFTFNGNNIAKLEYKMDIGGVTTTVQEAVYSYTGDKVTRIDVSTYDGAGLVLDSYDEYTYDSKKNPMYGVGLDYFLGNVNFLVANNTTVEKSTSAVDVVNEAKSINITYEYNTSDYPTKSTSLTFNNQVETVTVIEYKDK